MTNVSFPGGIYAILPSGLQTKLVLEQAEAAITGGIRLLQYRNKHLGYFKAVKQCKALRKLCSDLDADLIINDSVQLALECEANGVHLGREDTQDLTKVRQEVGCDIWLGVTCRGDAVLAKHAIECGADYLSFGAIFPSSSKPDVPVIGISRLQKARKMFPEMAICAIGGIGLHNIPQIKACGVESAAVISSLFSSSDITLEARTMVDAWERK